MRDHDVRESLLRRLLQGTWAAPWTGKECRSSACRCPGGSCSEGEAISSPGLLDRFSELGITPLVQRDEHSQQLLARWVHLCHLRGSVSIATE
jgi:hypothetical protein